MKYKIGDVLYFPEEDMIMVVAMVGENGIRYYDPKLPVLDDKCNMRTFFASNETLEEVTLSLGSIDNMSAMTISKIKEKIF